MCQPGTLFRLVQLYAYDDTVTNGANAVAAGNDVMLGEDGDDWMHGGAGVDLMNGDGDGGPQIVDPAHTYTSPIIRSERRLRRHRPHVRRRQQRRRHGRAS